MRILAVFLAATLLAVSAVPPAALSAPPASAQSAPRNTAPTAAAQQQRPAKRSRNGTAANGRAGDGEDGEGLFELDDELRSVLEKLTSVGDYSLFAKEMLLFGKPANKTKRAPRKKLINMKKRTIFMPVDTGMIRVTYQSYPGQISWKIFKFHIAKGLFSFEDLRALPSQSTIPTMEGSNITKVSKEGTKLVVQLKGYGRIPTTIVTPNVHKGKNTIVHGITSIMLPTDWKSLG